jgi:phage shock protein C
MARVYERQLSGIYRSRNGVILGVCRGIVEHLDFSVFWTRVIALAFLVCSGFWPIGGLYLLAALLMKPEPILPIATEEEQEFYNSYASSRSMALHRLQRTFDNLDRRIRRIESMVTAREYDWERRFNDS